MDRHDDENLYTHKYRDQSAITDYNDLTGKPSINGVTLEGNLTGAQLHLPTKTSDLTNDSGFITASDVPTKTSQLTNDSGFITAAAVPSKTSQLNNDSGYITASDVPSKTSQLTNDSGFITASDIPADLSDFNNDVGFLVGSDFSDLFLIKSFGSQATFTSNYAGIVTGISTALGTVLNSLAANEYVELTGVNVTGLTSFDPQQKVWLKKGDAVPSYILNKTVISGSSLYVYDLNAGKMATLALSNTNPAADYLDDYASDAASYDVTLTYNKYQKGL